MLLSCSYTCDCEHRSHPHNIGVINFTYKKLSSWVGIEMVRFVVVIGKIKIQTYAQNRN